MHYHPLLIYSGFVTLSHGSNVAEALTYIQIINNELTQLKAHGTLFWKESVQASNSVNSCD